MLNFSFLQSVAYIASTVAAHLQKPASFVVCSANNSGHAAYDFAAVCIYKFCSSPLIHFAKQNYFKTQTNSQTLNSRVSNYLFDQTLYSSFCILVY